MASEFIPISKPTVGEEEAKAASSAILSGWVSQGSFIEEFERQFAESHQCDFGVACSSGTAALELALRCLDLPPDSEVIIPNLTMIAVVNAVLHAGLKPVFAEVSGIMGNVTLESVMDRVTTQTRAVIIVHNYGEPVDDASFIRHALDRAGILLIEDCAEAHYAKGVARYGKLNTFSFYANKIITTGEGGMVITNDKHLSERMKVLRNHAFGPDRFIHGEEGLSCRISNVSAAIGVCQHNRRHSFIERRRQIKKKYIKDFEWLPIQFPTSEKSANWLLPVQTEQAISLASRLQKDNIEVRRYFYPMHRQSYLSTRQDFPHSDQLYQNGLCLPIFPSMTDEEVDRVILTVRDFYANL